jgi:adenylosuccinate synthase
MPHQIDMILDFQYGSTGKGLIAGWLAKRNDYDTAICAFATNAGHTYIDDTRALYVMTQQLPTAITSPTVKTVLLGPGSAIHLGTLREELTKYAQYLRGKRVLIHPHAAVVEDYHAEFEMQDGRTKMGSTAKGVGEAYIERIRRNPVNANTIANRVSTDDPIRGMIATVEEYRSALEKAESVIVEGAQGFSLSMYHGQYPYTTSRDVTPWQVAADCGLPYRWASYIKVVGTLRTFPIRVNNRDGSSGPSYPDQQEITWQDIGLEPELTTVTKLPRRIFTFSQQQLQEALLHCGGYWDTRLFLNFANYLQSNEELEELIAKIQTPTPMNLNPAKVAWVGYGPDDADVAPIL